MHSNSILKVLLECNPSLRDCVRPFRYAPDEIVARAGAPIASIFFPSDGLIASTLMADDGDEVEVGFYGRGSAIGAAVAFGAATYATNCKCQIAGAGWFISTEALITATSTSQALRQAIARHEHFVLLQAQQRALCNAKHSLHQRLATRLLRASDFCGSDVLHITQERLATWLGVQRASLSTAARKLQGEGMIQVRRGRISLLERGKLAAEACGCHTALRENETTLISVMNPSSIVSAQLTA